MKKILLLLCALGAIFTACSDKTPAPAIDILEGSETLVFSNVGGEQVVKFSSNGAWTAEVVTGADWITLSETSGAAGELIELTVSVSANGYDSRSGAILLTNGAATAQVVVEQSQENVLRLTGEASAVIDYTGGTFIVAVESNLAVTVNTGVDWITLAEPAARGLEENVYTFNVSANEETAERQAIVSFLADGVEPALFTLVQLGAVRVPNQIPANHIWYTTSDAAVLSPSASADFGAEVVKNTYEKGLGVIEFANGITKVGEGAFQNLTTLVSIVLPAEVTEIGANAFNGCSSLKSVYLSSLTPATLGADVFEGNATETVVEGEGETATETTVVVRYIYVPNAAVATYKAAEGWSAYADYIKGYDQETLPGFTGGEGVLE
ncbi:MAG: hypothetical protein E7147_04550 [Rikenellaceae bacterium]|nr:hypothetical protein [Rikenellaceae bacterium]